MIDASPTFLNLALKPGVVFSAIKVALVVGTILAFINHGGAIIKFEVGIEQLLKIVLSYFVPYCVSTYSAVKAIRCMQQTNS